MLTFSHEVSADQDTTAVIRQLAAQGRHPLLVFEKVAGLSVPVVTNIFASSERIARMVGIKPTPLPKSMDEAKARL